MAKAKKTTKKKANQKKNSNAADIEKLNETGQRKSGDRRVRNEKIEPSKERRKVKRRRQIDPTTCEREYSEQEIEFMRAMDEYKRNSGRMFPTCSEILEVLTKLGYRQIAEGQPLYSAEDDNPTEANDEAAAEMQTDAADELEESAV